MAVWVMSGLVGVQAETPDFTAFSPDGTLTWSYPTNDIGEYRLLASTGLFSNVWVDVLGGLMPTGTQMTVTVPIENDVQFYRVAAVLWHVSSNPPPEGMALIPRGIVSMGDSPMTGRVDELPVHTVNVAPFYADKYEVTLALWATVTNWAGTNGYDIGNSAANGRTNDPAQPVQKVRWHDCVKWCNARSEREGRIPAYYTSTVQSTQTVYRIGAVDVQNAWVQWDGNGYRLPTEAEWEKAARGGSNGLFPWGDTIAHTNANYYSNPYSSYSYDVSETDGWHPLYTDNDEGLLCTSPVGAFPGNGYGLYDVVGNVWEWCWDRYEAAYYENSPHSNPTGPETGATRLYRGGSWNEPEFISRLSVRGEGDPGELVDPAIGFRCVLRAVE